MLSPIPLVAQFPLRKAPVCVRLSYDSLDSGMVPADLPTQLQLGRGSDKGDVRALDSAYANARLTRGQGWTVSQNRDSSFSYFVTLGAHDIMLAYILTRRDSTVTGDLAALYLDRVNRRGTQRRAHVLAAIEPCPHR